MKLSFIEPDYSYTIEEVTIEDKEKIWINTKRSMRVYCLVFSAIGIVLTIPLFFLGLSIDDVISYLLLIALILVCVLLLTVLCMYTHTITGLKDKYKIVENGIITKQDAGGDSETRNYSYIGNKAYALLPGYIIAGDRVSVEHTINTSKKKKLFIQAKKMGRGAF